MFTFLKIAKKTIYNLLKYKIAVVFIDREVYSQIEKNLNTTVHEIVYNSDSIVNHVKKSNFRFISEKRTDHNNSTIESFYTEEFKNGEWRYVSDTMSFDKKSAIDLHLKLIDRGTLRATKTTTVLWEGLGKEETKVWSELHK